jgi:probable rRNA maturation factor
MIDLVNLQRKVKLDTGRFRMFIKSLSSAIDEVGGKSFSVAVVSDDRMKGLNQFFRSHDTTTDVLSFPYEPDVFESEPGAVATGFLSDCVEDSSGARNPVATAPGSDFLGDIVISADQAAKQAAENGLTLEDEIKQLILHGVLHLCGYDHETDGGEMNARELELREQLKI